MIKEPKNFTEQMKNLVEGMAIEMRKLRNSHKWLEKKYYELAVGKPVKPEPSTELDKNMREQND